MKPTQTVVLLFILVAMVFGITFASMYVRQAPAPTTPKNTGDAERPALQLVLPLRLYPPPFTAPRFIQLDSPDDLKQRVVAESGQPGHHDFWFENNNAEEVLVGLNKTNCTCSGVRLYVAPDEWRRPLAVAAARHAGLAAQGVLPALQAHAQAWQEARALIQTAEGLKKLDDKRGTPVPPRSFGFVRLEWDNRQSRDQDPRKKLTADLWQQDDRSGSRVELAVDVLFVEPLWIDHTSLDAGTLTAGQAAELSFRCWSSTRPAFRLEGSEPGSPLSSTGAPFVTCRIERLTDANRGNLPPAMPVTCGYRVHVTVREQVTVREGDREVVRRMNQGPFTHLITVVPVAGSRRLEPMMVRVKGQVRGDFTVEGSSGTVTLETFAVRRGTRRQVVISTDRQDLDLELVKHPGFMDVSLERPSSEGGRKRWKLDLEIAPNKISGTFPRPEGQLSDTAVYLKIKGESGSERHLRIPIYGRAIQ